MKPEKQSKQEKPKQGLGTPELSWDMAIDWGDLPELEAWDDNLPDWDSTTPEWDSSTPDWEDTGGQDGKNQEE